MAKTWYPVIDYSACVECGSCIDKCSHGVYNKDKAPTPIVILPDSCVGHCHGCGNICPSGAITYVGEDTSWTPPNGEKSEESDCNCGCDCECNCAGEKE
jgi:NAD-dependent dihydropyrimidine dehydrogenase PreA subunit